MMFKNWSYDSVYKKVKQYLTVVTALLTLSVVAQDPNEKRLKRNPASYIPDDDVIVKPVENKLSFYQQFVASDNSSEVVQSRNQLKVWNDNLQFAQQYGMDSSLAGSAYFVPTQEAKLQYFKDKYMRYLRQKGERPLRDAPKNWYQDYRASNEVDTIDEMESRFKSTQKKSGSRVSKVLNEKQVSLWKKTKFIFQPRIDQGLVIVGIKGPIANARAWVGVNGETEVNFQKSIDSIGFRMMFNYYVHSGEYFTSVDQRIMENVYARVTSLKKPDRLIKDETLMLLYAKQF